MSKFYRVIKENFLWEVDAIITNGSKGGDGYSPIDPIFEKCEDQGDEYISSAIVETSPEYFERVYPVNLLTKTVYRIKEEAKAMLAGQFE